MRKGRDQTEAPCRTTYKGLGVSTWLASSKWEELYSSPAHLREIGFTQRLKVEFLVSDRLVRKAIAFTFNVCVQRYTAS